MFRTADGGKTFYQCDFLDDFFFSGFHRGKIYIVYSKVKAACFGAARCLHLQCRNLPWWLNGRGRMIRTSSGFESRRRYPVMLIYHGFTHSQIPGLVPCIRWVMTFSSFPVRRWKLRERERDVLRTL